MATALSRRKLAEYIAAQIASGDAAEAVRLLAAYLIDAGRVREADLVVRDIEGELMKHGITVATVTTAQPLDAELKNSITALIGGGDIRLKEVVDPSVLGGVNIQLPGQQYDATIRRKLESLKGLALA